MARKLAKLTTTTGVLVGRRSSSGRPLNIRCNDRFYNVQAEEEEETCNRRMSLCGWSNIDTDGHTRRCLCLFFRQDKNCSWLDYGWEIGELQREMEKRLENYYSLMIFYNLWLTSSHLTLAHPHCAKTLITISYILLFNSPRFSQQQPVVIKDWSQLSNELLAMKSSAHANQYH